MFRFSQRKVIRLHTNDAALVLKENGEIEASLPDIKDAHVPENILMGAALMHALSCPETCRLIRERFLKEYCPEALYRPSNDQ